MRHKSLDLVVGVSLTVIAIGIILTDVNNEVARGISTLLLVLVLPGYMLTGALFPNSTLGIPERVVFSLGFSLALVMISGLVLDRTPWGLQAGSWVILLSSVTLGTALFIWWQRHKQPPTTQKRTGFGLNIYQIVLCGLAILVAIGAIEAARIGAVRQPREGFTQLWLLPGDDESEGETIRLGIISQELTTTKYTIQVKAGDDILHQWSPIELEPGGQWEMTVSIPVIYLKTTVEAILYRIEAPEIVYRRATLWRSNQ